MERLKDLIALLVRFTAKAIPIFWGLVFLGMLVWQIAKEPRLLLALVICVPLIFLSGWAIYAIKEWADHRKYQREAERRSEARRRHWSDES